MSNNLTTNGITIKQAIDWTAAWQKKHPNNPKAFLIPTTNIISLFKELKVLIPDANGNFIINDNNSMEVAIRAYMGLELNGTRTQEEKLVLVGAVKVGSEFQDQVEGTKNTLQVTLDGSGAFDFCLPCPKFCDPKSPLY